jgi:hypothetical protein
MKRKGRGKAYLVEARDRDEKLLWRIKVYTTEYSGSLEKEVQDIFITNIRISNGELLISDERNRTFCLNLKTKHVSRIK